MSHVSPAQASLCKPAPQTCCEHVLHPRLQHLDHNLLVAAAQHRGVHLQAPGQARGRGYGCEEGYGALGAPTRQAG